MPDASPAGLPFGLVPCPVGTVLDDLIGGETTSSDLPAQVAMMPPADDLCRRSI